MFSRPEGPRYELSMPPRLPLIISTASGAGRPDRLEPAIRKALGGRYALDFRYATTLGGLRAAIDEELGRSEPLVAVGGGDGTLHHAVNAIGDAPVTLAPLPLGTGNDFCRGLGLATLEASLDAIARGERQRIDLIEVNGRRVVTVAGVGVVARSALQVGRLARPGSVLRTPIRLLGALAYLAAGGLRLLCEPGLATPVQVWWRPAPGSREERVDGKYYGAFLAVRPTLGAGMRLPLDVKPDDGRFELVLVETAPRLTVARNLPRLRRGGGISPGILDVHQAVEVRIEWDAGTAVLGDGEDLGHAIEVRARILPGALSVVTGGTGV
jgi:diacylglycerol kinase (ATP)